MTSSIYHDGEKFFQYERDRENKIIKPIKINGSGCEWNKISPSLVRHNWRKHLVHVIN